MVTKLDIAEGAFQTAALSGLVMKPEPEDYARALSELERMVRSWEPQLKIGYSLSPSTINVDGTVDAMIADTAEEAVVMNLAMRILRNYAKEATPQLRADALAAKKRLYPMKPVTRKQNPLQPRGAGGNPYLQDTFYGAYKPTHDECECDDWPTPNC